MASKGKGNVGPAIGIDLGTTNCCVAVFRNNKNQLAEVIPNDLGKHKTPSYITFEYQNDEDGSEDDDDDDDGPYFGETAKDLAHENPKGTIFDVKRMLGRKFKDPRLQRDMEFWPFDIIEDPDQGQGLIKIKTGPSSTLSPIEAITLLMKHLKEQAETYLNTPISRAVVGVPAYFNEEQRSQTIQACEKAGLKVLQLVNEPTAAAVAYSTYKDRTTKNVHAQGLQLHSRNCLVFDLGGGTFDLAVLSIGHKSIKVQAIGGDAHLGGEDIDNTLVDYCIKQFKNETGIDLKDGKNSSNPAEAIKASKRLRRLKLECEKHKCFLSQTKNQTLTWDAIHGGKSLSVQMKRELFDSLNMELYKRCIADVEKVLRDAKINKDDIHDVILVGGSSRIPKLQEMLTEFFGGKQLCRTIDADEAVAIGAAMLAYYADNAEMPFSIQEPGIGETSSKFKEFSLNPSPKIEPKKIDRPSGNKSTPEKSKGATVGSSDVVLPKADPTPLKPPQAKAVGAKVASNVLVKPPTVQALDVGIYINQMSFEIGTYQMKFHELLSVTPELYFSDTRIVLGEEARSYAMQNKNRFFDIYKLITSTVTEPIHTIRLSVNGTETTYKLCTHQILSIFLNEALSYAGVAPGGKLVVTVPFEQNSVIGERIRKAVKLSGFEEVKILTTVISTAVATLPKSRCYSEGAKSNFPPKYVFVLDVDSESFCVGVVVIRPVGIFRVSARRSDEMKECQDSSSSFMQTHSTLYRGVDILANIKDQYRQIFEKAIDLLLLDLKNNNQVDMMVVSETTRKASLIIKIVEEILQKKVGAKWSSSFVEDPLLGAALVSASSTLNRPSQMVLEILPSNISLSDAESSSLQLTSDFGGAARKDSFGIFTKILPFSIAFGVIQNKGSRTFHLQLDQKIGKKGAVFEACRYELEIKVRELDSDEDEFPSAIQVKISYEVDAEGMYTLRCEIDEDVPVNYTMTRRDKLSCNSACDSRNESSMQLKKLVNFYYA